MEPVSEKVINKVLDLVSAPGGMGEGRQMELLHDFYETTLTALQEAKNDRLWFKTNLKLGKLWFDREEYGRLLKILKELHKSCQGPDGADDPKKGTQLLEVYALEIQMHTATKNNKKLKSLYAKALQIKSAIPHPKIMVRARRICATHALCAESTRCGLLRARAPLPAWPHLSSAAPPPPCGGGVAGRDPRVRRQDAHDAARVREGAQRLLRGLQELRRGGRVWAHLVPQVPRARQHAHELGHQPIRLAGGQALCAHPL